MIWCASGISTIMRRQYVLHLLFYLVSAVKLYRSCNETLVRCYIDLITKSNQHKMRLLELKTPEHISNYCSEITDLFICTASKLQCLQPGDPVEFDSLTKGIGEFYHNICMNSSHFKNGIFRVSSSKGEAKAIECFNELHKQNKITHLLLDVQNREQIDHFCKIYGELMKCINDNEHYLTIAQNTAFLKMINGVHQFSLNVCPPGSDITEDYKRNAPCFERARHQIVACGVHYSSLNQHSSGKVNWKHCCDLKEYTECVTKATKKRCGRKAGDVTYEILQRYYKSKATECQKLPEQNCVDEDSDWNEDKWSLDDDKNYASDEKWEEDNWEKHKHSGSGHSLASILGILVSLFANLYFIHLSDVTTVFELLKDN